ncbi:hypothetical protein H0X09_00210 [Candidatus Saccharibacteria bacterium]|nr:hypothetical protein [Candidatus Saccharibacteria bacterium]
MLKIKLSNFYVRSSMFTVLSLGGAFFNYLTYPVLSRVLDTSSFGNFTVILALSNQVLAILLAFNIISIYLVKKYPEKDAREKSQIIQKVLIWFFIAATILVLAFSPLINTGLRIDEPLTFLILAVILITAIPAVIWTGYLQGHKRLVQVGVYAFSGAFFKFVMAVTLGAIWGTVGALWGVMIGTIMGMLILRLVAGVKLPKISSMFSPFTNSERKFLSSLTLYTAGAVIVVGGLGILQNIDIIFAKALFDTHTAGVYSGISILSNAVYYISFLLVWIILPEMDPNNPMSNRRIIRSAYKVLLIMGTGALLLEVLFKNFITQALLGPEFANQGQILIFATLFQLSLVAVTLYAFYLLILRSRRSLLLALSVILPCLLLPWQLSTNPQNMIVSLWVSVILGVIIYFITNTIFRIVGKHGQAAS